MIFNFDVQEQHMSAITPAYDLLKAVPIPSDIDTLNAALQLKGDGELHQLYLQNASQAVNALKTKPAGEDKAELEAFVKSLTPLMAYALSDSNPKLQAHTVTQLKPMFDLFSDIYSKQYSNKALKEQVDNDELTPEQAEAFQKTKNALKEICKNSAQDLASFNKTAKLMQDFLLKLDFKQNPVLLDSMVKAFAEYKKENLDNLERFFENFGNSALKTIQNQSVHADYLQAWERVGYMLGNIFRATADLAIHNAKGMKIPLVELDQQQDMTGNEVMKAPDGTIRKRVAMQG
jgi:predicted DNA-binding protein YlxM (UPF0122 family)